MSSKGTGFEIMAQTRSPVVLCGAVDKFYLAPVTMSVCMSEEVLPQVKSLHDAHVAGGVAAARAPAPAPPGARALHNHEPPVSQHAPPHWPPGPRPRMHRRTENDWLGLATEPGLQAREKGAWRLWLGARGLRAGASRAEVCPGPVPAQAVSGPCADAGRGHARLPVSRVQAPSRAGRGQVRPQSWAESPAGVLVLPAYRPRQSRLDSSQDSVRSGFPSLSCPHGFL